MTAVNAFVAGQRLAPDSPVGWIACGIAVALVIVIAVSWWRGRRR